MLPGFWKRLACSLGLEVTQLFHQATRPALSRRGIESLRDRIVSRARSLYEKERRPIAIVSVIFNSSLNITRSDVPQLANKLMGVVIRNLPEQYGSKSEEFNWENRGWFPEEINRVSVSRFPEINDSHWYSPDAEYLPEGSIELVQSVIEKKNAKLVDYVKLVSECWLLIVLDDFRLSGAFIISQEVLDHTYSSGLRKFSSFSRLIAESIALT